MAYYLSEFFMPTKRHCYALFHVTLVFSQNISLLSRFSLDATSPPLPALTFEIDAATLIPYFIELLPVMPLHAFHASLTPCIDYAILSRPPEFITLCSPSRHYLLETRFIRLVSPGHRQVTCRSSPFMSPRQQEQFIEEEVFVAQPLTPLIHTMKRAGRIVNKVVVYGTVQLSCVIYAASLRYR